jgi:hypothetical protein
LALYSVTLQSLLFFTCTAKFNITNLTCCLHILFIYSIRFFNKRQLFFPNRTFTDGSLHWQEMMLFMRQKMNIYNIDSLRVQTWRPIFDTGLLHACFVENIVAKGRGFLQLLRFPQSHSNTIRVYLNLNNNLIRRTSRRSLVAFKQNIFL